MAEPINDAPVPGMDQRLIIVAGVILVFLFVGMFFGLRACSKARSPEFTTIYSDLELKDAAKVKERLKELRIPVGFEDDGRTIKVPRDKADEARLGLAIKGLPEGGVVGFEIFDTTRFGATDFDKRIQFVRAISGELSRTIRKIQGVEDARVQIVVPKAELFAGSVAPVTASVWLRLLSLKNPLSNEQVKGIIHLVSSSVENLLPENVTVVDSLGRILSMKEEIFEPVKPETKEEKKEEATTTFQKEEVKPLTTDEILKLELKAKDELEKQLSRRAQAVINKFYPPNTAIVQVNLELGTPSRISKNAEEKKYQSVTLGEIKKITAVILIDNRFQLTRDLKKSTFAVVAGTIGYNSKRGDMLELQKVPFHLATIYDDQTKNEFKDRDKKPNHFLAGFSRALKIVVVAILIGLIIFPLYLRLKKKKEEKEVVFAPAPPRPHQEVERVKEFAAKNPERLAGLIKRWLSEEK